MNRRQKSLLVNAVLVFSVTLLAVFVLANFKDHVNRSEAIKAMEGLGRVVIEYRVEKGQVPPESYIDAMKKELPGNVRLGKLKYRARWISFDAPADEVLAYTRRDFKSFFFSPCYIVLRLNGTVEWLGIEEFEKELASIQSPLEVELMKSTEIK